MGFLGGLNSRMRAIDGFPKLAEDLRVRTASGGTLSLLSGIIVAFLVFSEFWSYLQVERIQKLGVDADEGGIEEHLKIKFDVDFPWINCEVLGVDSLDGEYFAAQLSVSGNSQLEITENVYKTPISHSGEKLTHRATRVLSSLSQVNRPSTSPLPKGYCGSCYGASGETNECCNTCLDVYNAYEKRGWSLKNFKHVDQCIREGIRDAPQILALKNKFNPEEGCNIAGVVEVLRLEGSFHFAPGHSFQWHGRQLHDMSVLRGRKMDLSHTIHKLSFGEEEYSGMVNALDGKKKKADKNMMGEHEYFLKLVPTSYGSRWGRMINTFQYSVTEFFKKRDVDNGVNLLPGVFFHYTLSPIRITVEERRKSFAHFIVQLCAIIGGVVTVTGLLDKGFYLGARALKKRQFGKLA